MSEQIWATADRIHEAQDAHQRLLQVNPRNERALEEAIEALTERQAKDVLAIMLMNRRP